MTADHDGAPARRLDGVPEMADRVGTTGRDRDRHGRTSATTAGGVVHPPNDQRDLERARVTLDSIGDCLISTDIDCRVLYLNRAAEAMSGWSSHEAAGRLLPEVLHLVDADTRAAAPNPAEAALRRDARIGLPSNCVLVR